MQITRERALWILDYYRKSGTELAFGGKILGEKEVCLAKIAYVWPETDAIGVRLLTDDGNQHWDRMIPLKNAEFVLGQLGEAHYERLARTGLHSILIIKFPDGTTMFFAEQA